MRIVSHAIDVVDFRGIRRLIKEGLLSHWSLAQPVEEIAPTGSSGERQHIAHLAGQFALMEAVSSACGELLDEKVDWNDIHVRRNETGQPVIELSGELAGHCQNLGITDWVVNIAHTPTCAVGTAIAIA